MISVYNLKSKFQKLLRPILVALHNRNVSANQITIAAIILSVFIGIAFWHADRYSILFLTLPIGLLFRMGLNALDGMMAREYNQQTKRGELLNEVGDIVSDVIIFFPLLKFEKENIYLIAAFICLAIINEFVGLIGKVVGTERRYEGPMGKSDRALVLSIYGLAHYYFDDLTGFMLGLFIVVVILLSISTIIRFSKATS